MVIITPAADPLAHPSSFWKALIKNAQRLVLPTRYIVILLSALATALQYTMRVNLSVTIVAMVNQSAFIDPNATGLHRSLQGCPAEPFSRDYANGHAKSALFNNSSEGANSTQLLEQIVATNGNFEWSPSMQGLVLGAFYYGYIMTHIFAGQLAERLGARWLIAVSILTSSALTLLTPLAAYFHVTAVVILRVVTGMAQGVMSPAMYTMFAKWIPEQERSTALALLVVGGNVGVVLTMPLAGYLSQHYSWEVVFYVLGISGCVCLGLWLRCVYSAPVDHPRISATELIFIHANLNQQTNPTNALKAGAAGPDAPKAVVAGVSWTSLLTSRQTWTIAAAKFCGAWGTLMLMSKLPAYLESVLHFPIEKNGFVNSLVYISLSASLTMFGYLSDLVGRKGWLSKDWSRKLFETIGLVVPAICMGLIPVVGCDQNMVIALLVLAMLFNGAIAGGDNPIVMDVAPAYSGSLYGFTNAVASTPGFLAPLFVGLLLDSSAGPDNDSMRSWDYVFFSASAIYVLGAIIFLLVAHTKAKKWGVIGDIETADSGNEEKKDAHKSVFAISAKSCYDLRACEAQSRDGHKSSLGTRLPLPEMKLAGADSQLV